MKPTAYVRSLPAWLGADPAPRGHVARALTAREAS